jgi:hypothetical protein
MEYMQLALSAAGLKLPCSTSQKLPSGFLVSVTLPKGLNGAFSSGHLFVGSYAFTGNVVTSSGLTIRCEGVPRGKLLTGYAVREERQTAGALKICWLNQGSIW